MASVAPVPRLVDQFQLGLDAPICLTWELTYACNLACVHCLSSSGRRDPRELTTEAVQGGDRRAGNGCRSSTSTSAAASQQSVPDFWELVDYATAHHVGGEVLHQRRTKSPPRSPHRLAASDYVDVQISLDGATAEVNDAVRGSRLVWTWLLTAYAQPPRRGVHSVFKLSVVITRENVAQLDAFKAIADRYEAQATDHAAAPLGTRRRRVGSGCIRPRRNSVKLSEWLLRPRRRRVLTGDSFFHLERVRGGAPLAGLEPVRRRARGVPDRPGRRCVRVPVRDPRFLSGRERGGRAAWGFAGVWRESRAVRTSCARPQSGGACGGAAGTTTGAAAAAWRRSSPPACRWTAPTRNASLGNGEPVLAR